MQREEGEAAQPLQLLLPHEAVAEPAAQLACAPRLKHAFDDRWLQKTVQMVVVAYDWIALTPELQNSRFG